MYAAPVKLIIVQFAVFAVFSFVTRLAKTAFNVVAGTFTVVCSRVVAVAVALSYHKFALVLTVTIAVVLA